MFLVVSIIIGYLLNQTNCQDPDPMCDPDPLYGGCSQICESGSLLGWAGKSFGTYILLSFAVVIYKDSLKNKDDFKQLIASEDLIKWSAKQALSEILTEEEQQNRAVSELVKRKVFNLEAKDKKGKT